MTDHDLFDPRMQQRRAARSRAARAALLLLAALVLATGTALVPVTARAWSPAPPMPTAREGAAATALNGLVIVTGGYQKGPLVTVETYDPAARRWRAISRLLIPRHFHAAASLGRYAYVAGGMTTRVGLIGAAGAGGATSIVATVERLDPTAKGGWAAVAAMPTPRYGLALAAANGHLYAIGGYNDSAGVLGAVEEYDPGTNTWRTMAPMPTPRMDLAAVAVNGLVYAIGGSTGSSATGFGAAVATVEVFDPVQNVWSTACPLSAPRAGLAAAADPASSKLLAVGGRERDVTGTFESASVAGGACAWTLGPPLSTPRKALVAAVVNGALFAIGGYDEDYLQTSEVQTGISGP